MTFNSWEFLIFYPITLLLYFLLPKKWSRISLLFMSAIFYLAWNYKLIVLIMFTTAVSYFCARIIEKTEKKAVKKLCLVVTLIACLGVLFFFKYSFEIIIRFYLFCHSSFLYTPLLVA